MSRQTGVRVQKHCRIAGCWKPYYGHGLCRQHYEADNRWGIKIAQPEKRVAKK